MAIEDKKAKFAQPGNEAAVLACVLKDPSNLFEVESKLSDNDFLSPHNKALWVVLKQLMRQGVMSPDITSILSQAASLDIEKIIGGYEYVSSLFEKRVDPENLGFYLKRLADASVKYKAVCVLTELDELIDSNRTLTGETLDAETIVSLAQDKFLQISIESNTGEDAVDLYEGLPELLAEATAAPSSVRGVATGFTRLDELINGLEPGTLTVLGARPKVGKSAFLLNVAKHMAYVQKVPVLILDTEMSSREQRFRLASIMSGVPERILKSGTYKDDPVQSAQVQEALAVISTGRIMHKYYPDFTPEGVTALTKKYRHQYDIGCLIFDYIKLPDADLQLIGNVKEHQALGYLCVSLKNLAGQLQIPVITAAQIGRMGANKGRATASEFADSDRILRYANTLLGLSAKTKDEIEKLKEEHGLSTYLKMGTHRLQVLETRGGGTDQFGLDIVFRKDLIRMWEADVQLKDLEKSKNPEEDNDV